MKQNRISNKLKLLKVGDTVVLHENYSERTKPRECTVTKIGRQYIYIDYPNDKFSIEHGYGNYGMYIFPGNTKEYEEEKYTIKLRRELSSEFDKKYRDLTREEVVSIMNIIKEENE